jgi:hypothetical protein
VQKLVQNLVKEHRFREQHRFKEQHKPEPKGEGRKRMKMKWAHNSQQTSLRYIFKHYPKIK